MSTDTPTTPAEPLDDATLAAIEARAEAATPGPWEPYSYRHDGAIESIAYLRGEYLRGVGLLEFGIGTQADADRAFVMHARADIPTLLAEVERAREGEAAARSETMQVAGELAEECLLHQGTMAERDRLRARVAELEQPPTTWQLPPEPPGHIRQLWDRDDTPWRREVGTDRWSDDGGGRYRSWGVLLVERGPLSATPPAETEAQ